VIECQTLDLIKLSQKIADSHIEVLQMSDHVVQELIARLREDIAPLFKISEGIAMLDMIAAFAHLALAQDYCHPELTSTLAIKEGRHPMREKIQTDKLIPNDVYAVHQSRFQIITGCNMSGKSTYIRSIALMAVMAQVGSFVPATYASFPIYYELFARISVDDSIEGNVSTFAAEMREAAFILANISKGSLVIVDELGRGTSTQDGLCIAIAIAEAFIDSGATVWFVTHFHDLAKCLVERPGVVNMHLAVDIMKEADRMSMLYKIKQGIVKEEHYGIALAKVIDLPPQVIEVAEQVSQKIRQKSEEKKKTSPAVLEARRRKLIFSVRDQLKQVKESTMDGEVLRSHLKALQTDFVVRMSAWEDEAAKVERDWEKESVAGESVVETDAGRTAREGISVTDQTTTEDLNGDGRFMMSGAL
jgi:DNA mismatch repair protein MSH4